MLAMLVQAHDAGELKFFNTHAGLADKRMFKRFIAPLRRTKWVVDCKAPFAGPEQVLRYISRYTHRVAISNRRLVAADSEAIAFRWKDYRRNGANRWNTMRLHPHELIRRFLLHVLPAPHATRVLPYPCPCCGARMIVIEVFARGCQPSWRPTLIRIDTS